ncbi:MAG: hypothetical protein ACOXZW_01720 [Bacilli bacterium]|jgi:predicted nucleotidyltransferase|nr:nucleotidyltransferase domain-containing protein [Bacilli bacterium]
MASWEQAVKKFLKKYSHNKNILGAMLIGSYAVNNYKVNSDIDLQLITSDDVKSERGIVVIDNYLIDYYINTLDQLVKMMERDYDNGEITRANAFKGGRILFGNSSAMAELKERAETYLTKELRPLSKVELSTKKYNLWRTYIYLFDNHDNHLFSYYFIYYNLLRDIMILYYEYYQIPRVDILKLEKIYTDKTYRERYNITKMPSQEYIKLFLNCLTNASIKIMNDNITKLYDLVQAETGGFKIENFKVKGELL